jgi:flavodoxin I
MKTLVVYDSVYGNTGEIAKSIGVALGDETSVIKVAEATASDLESVALLIAGSPTYGGRPTPAMKEFLDRVKNVSLQGVAVAAFDTRASQKWVRIFTFAAPKIEKALKSRGGTPAVKPEGFFVTGTQGPLADGENERAAAWAKKIVENTEK